MYKFSEKTIKILTESGWYADRKVDVSSTVKFLETRGFQVFPCVVDALEQFGGLEYEFVEENFVIIPEEQMGEGVNKVHFKRYDILIGEYLVVIGSAFRDGATLAMSESGKVYGLRDNTYIWKFGDHIYEAVNKLCENKEFKTIYET